ncbi:MAG: response regulator [Syntrophomonadaceae bacterium]|nr:response regulator [Syntrophomonadaceae bacterium]
MAKIQVLIVDDVAQTRKEICRLLQFENDMTVVGEAGNGQEAVALAQELQPDVILMDVNMPMMDGITATQRISLEVPKAATIIISIQGEHEYLKKAMLAGAREYLVKPLASEELAFAIRRVYELAKSRNLSQRDAPAGKNKREGRLIMVFSPKGGVGKTTIATNAAIALAQQRQGKTALVDLDLQFGDVALMLNLDTRRNICELSREEDDLDAEVVNSYLIPHFSGVRVLIAPPIPQEAELVKPAQISSILSAAQQQMDFIVIDTAPGLSDLNLDLWEMCHELLLVVTPDLATLKSAKSCLDVMAGLNLNHKTSIILNRHNLKMGIKPEDIEKILGTRIWRQVPNDEDVVTQAVNKGLPFILGQSRAPISHSITDLAEGLIGEEGLARTVGRKKSLAARIFNL